MAFTTLLSRRPRRVTAGAVSVVLLVSTVTAVAFAPAAYAVPGITMAKAAPTSVLADGAATYTLTAANPSANPTAAPEYNLSFRDVLPLGVTYVPGSTTPATAGEPTVITATPSGQQTLVWRNVGDLQIGDSFALTFRADTDPTVLPVGSTFTNTASSYANTNPRRVPSFTAAGVAIPLSFTESATASGVPTTVSALSLTKSEPSPEGELLRGVHDHTTVYSLEVANTDVSATSGVVVTDYLPASLEFLGCGGVDNSAAPEYAGAPSLTATPTPPGCVAPVSVTTVSNPPAQGSTIYPPGIYTRVQWNLGTMAPGDTITLRYAAGVPLRANTLTFPGGTPTGASLLQTANLDNNTGPSTRETASEAGATNIARASGTYSGPVTPGGSTATAVDARETVTIEDVRMRKSVTPTQFSVGGSAQYTVTIETSEYVSASGVVVTDVIPNGMCPLGPIGVNYVTGPGEPTVCTGAGPRQPSVPIDTVTQNPDGTFTTVFQPLAAPIPVNGTATVTYWAGMREIYTGGPQAGLPTSSGDEFTNAVSLAATTTPRPGTGETGTQTVTDTSSATIGTSGLTIDKTIGPRSLGGVCGTTGAGYGEPSDFAPAETQFRKGDLICFKVRVDFSSTIRTRNPVITDFLPVGTDYVSGTATPTTNNFLAPAEYSESPDGLVWTLGNTVGPARFIEPGAVFEWVFAAVVTDAAPIGSPDILGNSMKLRYEDSGGRGRSLRDELDFTIAPAVPIGLVKGIQTISSPSAGPNGLNSNVDNLPVREGSVVRFRIDLTNRGTAGAPDGYAAGGFDLWDVLPENVRCVNISNIAAVASNPLPATIRCTNPGDPQQPQFTDRATRSAIRWIYTLDPLQPLANQGINPGQSWTYTYDMTIPAPTSAGFVFTNTASLRSYAAVTNVDSSRPGATALYYPQSNVDTTVPPAAQQSPAASDPSNVYTPVVTVGKVGSTSITEPEPPTPFSNNNAPNQATIGELVTYRYAVTIPAGTTVFDGTLTDTLPAGFVLQASPAPTVEFCPVAPTPTGGDPLPVCAAPGAVPANVTLNAATGALAIAGTFDNTTASPQRLLVTTTVRVTTGALTTTQNAQTRTNTARFVSSSSLGGPALAAVQATYDVNVRQPAPTLTKTNNRSGTVAGGDVVTFTIQAFNRNSATTTTNRPPLHDTFVVDCLPTGLTFQAYGANPGIAAVAGDGTNGCATGTTRLVWALGTMPPSITAVTRTYTATVSLAAVGGDSYTNAARLTGSSLNDGKPTFDAPDNPNERVYAATANSSVTVGGSPVTKAVDQPIRTIGQTAQFTVTATVPATTNFYDFTVLDRMPSGMSAPAGVTFACLDIVTNLPCAVTGSSLAPVAQPAGVTLHGFTVGDLLASPNARRLTVTYTSTVLDVAAATAGAALTDTVQTAWFSVNGPPPTSAGAAFDRLGATATATVTVVEPALTITKGVTDTTPAPGQSFDYTLTVRNGSGASVSAAYNVAVSDTVPLGVVVDSVTGGGVLTGADPVRGGGTITWPAGLQPGPLAPGATYVLAYTAHLAPSATLTASGLLNTARITSYASLPSGGRVYPAATTTATVTPAFPRLDTAKAATSGAPAYIGTPYTWTVTVTNTGDAQAFGVDVRDLLPPSWTYDAGSAVVSVAGATGTPVAPVVTPGAQQELLWSNLGTLLPGQNLTVTYQATPGAGVVATPGVGSTVSHTNTAISFGDDATGAPGNLTGDYGNRPATASTRIDSADVRIVKSHAGSPVAGTSFDWSLLVTNGGPDTAVGPFVVTDTIQAPATFVSASGTGWSCSAVGADVSCSRSNPANTLASGALFSPITVRVSVPATTADATVISNSASVTARTYDPLLPNNTSTDTAAVVTRADLAITKVHTGDVVPGQNATYTLDVVNNGPSVSRGPIVVQDTLPAGATFVSAAGAGWSCAPGTGTVTCTRAADLAPGQAAGQITLVVQIPSGQTADVVNTATVSGPTIDPVPGNNTDDDRATPAPSADLSIQKANTTVVAAGQTSTYRLTVDNAGPSDAQNVRITDTLPTGLTYAGTSTSVRGTWSCSAAGQVVTCLLAGTLAADPNGTVNGDAIVDVDVAVASDVVGIVTNTAVVDSSTPDPNPGNNTDTETTEFDVEADLAIVKSHTGNAVAGQELTWTLSVSNNGPSNSPGTITVTDGLPVGTSYLRFRGTGWSCSAVGQIVTCDRTAGLGSGATAPDLEIDVLVADAAGPGVLINSASVDGPATDPVPGNNTDTDPVTVVDVTELVLTKSTTGADPVRAGETTEFTIAVENTGPSTADSVVVTDTLPAGLVPLSASGTGWTCPAPVGQLVRCTRDALAPSTSSIVVTARVDSAVPDGTTLTNTATVTTSTPGDNPANNTDSSTVDVIARADLVLVKGHDAQFDEVPAGQQGLFTIDVRNEGPSDAQPDLVVTDTLPAGLTYVSAAGPWACVPGAVTATGQVVVCTSTDGVPLAAGSSASTLSIAVATEPSLDPGSYTNSATVESPTIDPTPGNNTDTDDLVVTTLADLSITKEHTAAARVGDALDFTLTAANQGPSEARSVTVTDTVPSGLEFVAATGAGWTCVEAAAVVTCDFAGPLAPNTTAAPITLTVTVLPGAYPEVSNTATVDSSTPEVDPADNSDTDVVTVPALVDLSITKTHAAAMQVGQRTTYTLTVTNAGPTPDPGPITITDQLPTGLAFVSGSGDGWACTAAAATVTCTRSTLLGVGASTSMQLVVDVLPAAVPSVVNVAAVSTPSEETSLDNNTATDPGDVAPLVELGLTKQLGNLDAAGMRATWIISVTNNGPNASRDAIVVTDVLPAGLSFVSAAGPGWVCAVTGGRTVTCTYAASLPVDGTIAFELVTAITAAAGTTVVNEAGRDGNIDPNPDNDTSSAQLVVPGGGGDLPRTGADLVALGLMGLVLLMLGLAFVGTSRRRPELRA